MVSSSRVLSTLRDVPECPSTAGNSQRSNAVCGAPSMTRGARTSDIFSAALSAKRDLAGVGELARDGEDFLLGLLDIREFHRALRFEIVAQHFGRPLRHVLENLLLHAVAR